MAVSKRRRLTEMSEYLRPAPCLLFDPPHYAASSNRMPADSSRKLMTKQSNNVMEPTSLGRANNSTSQIKNTSPREGGRTCETGSSTSRADSRTSRTDDNSSKSGGGTSRNGTRNTNGQKSVTNESSSNLKESDKFTGRESGNAGKHERVAPWSMPIRPVVPKEKSLDYLHHDWWEDLDHITWPEGTYLAEFPVSNATFTRPQDDTVPARIPVIKWPGPPLRRQSHAPIVHPISEASQSLANITEKFLPDTHLEDNALARMISCMASGEIAKSYLRSMKSTFQFDRVNLDRPSIGAPAVVWNGERYFYILYHYHYAFFGQGRFSPLAPGVRERRCNVAWLSLLDSPMPHDIEVEDCLTNLSLEPFFTIQKKDKRINYPGIVPRMVSLEPLSPRHRPLPRHLPGSAPRQAAIVPTTEGEVGKTTHSTDSSRCARKKGRTTKPLPVNEADVFDGPELPVSMRTSPSTMSVLSNCRTPTRKATLHVSNLEACETTEFEDKPAVGHSNYIRFRAELMRTKRGDASYFLNFSDAMVTLYQAAYNAASCQHRLNAATWRYLQAVSSGNMLEPHKERKAAQKAFDEAVVELEQAVKFDSRASCMLLDQFCLCWEDHSIHCARHDE